ncbi:MAG: gliding motility-associated ABC transporter permease subunit GldF [Chitinophagaceae bacterium]
MFSIFKKEINAFLSSLVGYIAIGTFLVVMGFFLWFIPEQNILDFGYANLDKFFALAPWVLMFLLPSITMRSFADEFKSGTIELLSTMPIKENQLILGKFWASFVLVIFSLLPTFVYIITLSSLSIIENNLDTGGIIGSYLGLFLLSAVFTSIGLFCSALTSNQVIAFLLAVILNFFIFMGFEYLSQFPIFNNGIDYILSYLGLHSHYQNISRGLIDSRDVLYFLSIILLFIMATKHILNKRKN